MPGSATPSTAATAVRNIIVGLVFLAIVILLLLWLAGTFAPKIDAAHAYGSTAPARPVGDTPLVAARLIRTPVVEPAVGTIRAVHEIGVASKLLAKVVVLNVQAGQEMHEGDVLVRLDDEDLKARVQQAQAGVQAAQAARDQAQVEFERTKSLFDQGHAAPIEFERDQTRLKSAHADLERAQQGLREAETILGYATLRSPLTGKIVDKLVEAGDTVTPGQVLLTLYDPQRMQLVASVRESLTQRLQVGQTIGVRVDALEKTCEGQISEIVPEAQTASRTFQVKVTGPCPPGIYTGMFGRLLIPLDDQEVLVIPRAAVHEVGQLRIVAVAEKSNGQEVLRRRAVRLGKDYGDDVEVLSGLRSGEKVAVRAVPPANRSEASPAAQP